LDQFQALLIPQSGGFERSAFGAGPALAEGQWGLGDRGGPLNPI
jgi:hypothetical protein